jgi:very-short-patch-repair endonuclease
MLLTDKNKCFIIHDMGRPKGSKNGIRQLIEKTCEICVRAFQVEPYRATARFCSRSCQAAGHSKELLKPEERRCRYCEIVFVVTPSSEKIYCTRKCASKAHGAKVTGTHLSTVYISSICPICAKSFSARKTLYQKFCSRKCANVSYQRTITLSCQICEKPFTVRAKLSDQKFCSRTCRTIGIGKTESYIERAFAAGLESVGIEAHAQYPIGPYTLDFAIPERRIVIECDGNYWHSRPECIKRDRRKDKFLTARGWDVLRFSETDINAELNECLLRVRQALSKEDSAKLS